MDLIKRKKIGITIKIILSILIFINVGLYTILPSIHSHIENERNRYWFICEIERDYTYYIKYSSLSERGREIKKLLKELNEFQLNNKPKKLVQIIDSSFYINTIDSIYNFLHDHPDWQMPNWGSEFPSHNAIVNHPFCTTRIEELEYFLSTDTVQSIIDSTVIQRKDELPAIFQIYNYGDCMDFLYVRAGQKPNFFDSFPYYYAHVTYAMSCIDTTWQIGK